MKAPSLIGSLLLSIWLFSSIASADPINECLTAPNRVFGKVNSSGKALDVLTVAYLDKNNNLQLPRCDEYYGCSATHPQEAFVQGVIADIQGPVTLDVRQKLVPGHYVCLSGTVIYPNSYYFDRNNYLHFVFYPKVKNTVLLTYY